MAAGTNLNNWDFHGEETERWIFELLETGYYVIHSANSSGTTYYLGVDSDSTSSGADIVLRTGSITNGMKWKIEPTSSGAFKFVPKSASSMALAIKTALIIDLEQQTYSNDTVDIRYPHKKQTMSKWSELYRAFSRKNPAISSNV